MTVPVNRQGNRPESAFFGCPLPKDNEFSHPERLPCRALSPLEKRSRARSKGPAQSQASTATSKPLGRDVPFRVTRLRIDAACLFNGKPNPKSQLEKHEN